MLYDLWISVIHYDPPNILPLLQVMLLATCWLFAIVMAGVIIYGVVRLIYTAIVYQVIPRLRSSNL